MKLESQRRASSIESSRKKPTKGARTRVGYQAIKVKEMQIDSINPSIEAATARSKEFASGGQATSTRNGRSISVTIGAEELTGEQVADATKTAGSTGAREEGRVPV